MSIGRRKILASALGLGQCALLERAGLFGRRARAQSPSKRPTRLLCIHVPGGVQHELFWCPFADADIASYVPPWEKGGVDAAHMANFDGSGDADADTENRRIRGAVTWNWAAPDEGHPNYSSNGYAWAAPEYRLFERTAVVHGIDQGTAAHESGVIAGMCGLAGPNFAIPAIPAVVTNYFADVFPDRMVPSVVIGEKIWAPAVSLPGRAAATRLNRLSDLDFTLSDKLGAWDGLRSRKDVPRIGFDGTPQDGTLPLTAIDAAVMETTRRLRGASSSGTDAALEQLHEQYALLSRTLATDVVSVIQATPGVEYLPQQMPWAPQESRFGWRIGFADDVRSDTDVIDQFDLALRLLKSNLCTSVSLTLPTGIYLDTHGGPYIDHRNYLRGAYEVLGRLLIEMLLTPSPDGGGRTLLDDTLVYVFSEFGRTFQTGDGGSDHFPMTSVMLIGGAVKGNQMIGGFAGGDPNGRPIAIREEAGDVGMRPARAQDTAATIFTALGMQAGDDFFLPGGYGSFADVEAT